MNRTPDVIKVCDSKVMYDTEWEATRAAIVYDHDDGEMRPYRCPGTNHFHITHVQKNKRVGHGRNKVKCLTCNDLISKNNIVRHRVRCERGEI